ncbi:glutathione-regulated potassium-efflux system ancillary protein KefF [Citrobacter koseri]|nr:glutathione-regulated potassium-efflux system ancillary protein KefF [Citrobacter koseri]
MASKFARSINFTLTSILMLPPSSRRWRARVLSSGSIQCSGTAFPPLLKLWMDKVLAHGWAYGHGGTALRGKDLMWAVTTGGGESHFAIGAYPGFDVLSQPLQATALYCGAQLAAAFCDALYVCL